MKVFHGVRESSNKKCLCVVSRLMSEQDVRGFVHRRAVSDEVDDGSAGHPGFVSALAHQRSKVLPFEDDIKVENACLEGAKYV